MPTEPENRTSATTRVDHPLDDWGSVSPEIGVPLDEPMTNRGVILWESASLGVEVGIWDVDPGRLSVAFPNGTETVHVLSGSIVARPWVGLPFTLEAGDTFVFAKGWDGIWELPTTMRKTYTYAQHD